MTINAMTVSAGQSLDVLKAGWKIQTENGIKMSYMLHGRPGIGKTQIAEALADHIGGRLYDIRLTQIDTSDLRGLPYYDHDTKTTQWYRPEDLPNTDEPAVLFLDEITAASPFLTPTVYGLLQERRVGMHKIPDNTIIVAAGNTVDDGAVAYEMGTAIADRLVHMYVQADAEDWIESFAIPNDLHPAVIAFIKTRPDLLETSQESMKADHMIAATPRSWHRVSDIMQNVADRRIRTIMISGTIGEAVCADFTLVADDIAATVQVTEMVKKPRAERAKMYPVKMVGLNAMVFGLLGYVEEKNADAVIEIMIDIGNLLELRPEAREDLKLLPLKEMATNGFEALINKMLPMGMGGRILDHPAYQEYTRQRESLGLE
jgi:DNA polymerase III delta prime subunit